MNRVFVSSSSPRKTFALHFFSSSSKAMDDEDASAAPAPPRRGGARSAATMTTAARRGAKKEALASPRMPGISEDLGDGEENFLSVGGALDFNCSPIGGGGGGAAAARKGKGDAAAQPAAAGSHDDDLNMEVSPLKQLQQPKSAAKVIGREKRKERRRENGHDDDEERALAPSRLTCVIKRLFFRFHVFNCVTRSQTEELAKLMYARALSEERERSSELTKKDNLP